MQSWIYFFLKYPLAGHRSHGLVEAEGLMQRLYRSDWVFIQQSKSPETKVQQAQSHGCTATWLGRRQSHQRRVIFLDPRVRASHRLALCLVHTDLLSELKSTSTLPLGGHVWFEVCFTWTVTFCTSHIKSLWQSQTSCVYHLSLRDIQPSVKVSSVLMHQPICFNSSMICANHSLSKFSS